jgi:hypothetical protein
VSFPIQQKLHQFFFSWNADHDAAKLLVDGDEEEVEEKLIDV